MTTKEMKMILADKLKDENTYFTMSDISIKHSGKNYRIVIKEYEHISFRIKFENDDFGDCICVYRHYGDNKNMIIFEEGHNENSIKSVLIQLGYYIGTRF